MPSFEIVSYGTGVPWCDSGVLGVVQVCYSWLTLYQRSITAPLSQPGEEFDSVYVQGRKVLF